MNFEEVDGQQLPLSVGLRDDDDFDSFYVGDANHLVVETMKRMPEAGGEPFIYVWGESGSGKSHLLQAVCKRAFEAGYTAFYAPLKEYLAFPVEALQDLASLDLVCLDDVDALAGHRNYEEMVFTLFNCTKETGKPRLLMSAAVAPRHLEKMLPDLRSRLSSMMIFHLQALKDEEKLRALKRRAHARGLDLPDEVGWFLLRRCPRHMKDLFTLLEQLDTASMAMQRRLTIPFVKAVLGV